MLNATIVLKVVLMGVGATVAMDLWLLLLQRLGVPTQNFAMIGRWAAHLLRGRWWHAPISASPRAANELALGWLVHYAVGIGFAAVLVALAGPGWLDQPSLSIALVFGLVTVLVPFLVMQPAMGQGIAASRTPMPLQNRLRSLANHTVFGLGLYLSAVLIASI